MDLSSPPQLATIGIGLGAVDFELGTLAHNEYVRLIVETGFLGLLSMFFLYRGLYRITINGYRSAPDGYERDMMLAFLCVFWSRLVLAVSDNVIIFPVLEWYFWSFAAMIVVMSGAYRHAAPAERESEGIVRPLAA